MENLLSNMEFNSTSSVSKPRKQISPSNNYSLNGKIMLCSVIVLFVAILVIICFHGYARWSYKRRRRAENRLISLHNDGVASRRNAPRGLDLSVLKKLPTFLYNSTNDRDRKFSECAVCLSEFEDGEEGRVLPDCKHTFHIECIDMWFYSHSNCPLCRAPVKDSDFTEIVVEKAGSMSEPDGLVPGLGQENQEGCSSSTISEAVLPLGQQRREDEFVGVVVEEPSSNGVERVSGLGLDSTTNQRLKPTVSGIFGLKRMCSTV